MKIEEKEVIILGEVGRRGINIYRLEGVFDFRIVIFEVYFIFFFVVILVNNIF